MGEPAVSSPWWAALGPVQQQVTCGDQRHVIRWSDGQLLAASHPDAEGELVLAALGGETPRCVELLQAWGARGDDLEVLAIGPRSAADKVAVATSDDDDVARYRPVPLRYGLWGGPPRQALFASAVRAHRRRPATAGWSGAHHGGIAGSRPMIPGPMPLAGTSPARRRGRARGWSAQLGKDLEQDMARQNELRMLFALGTEFQWRLSGTVAAAWSASRPGHDLAAAEPALTAALAGRLAPVARAWLGADPDRVEVTLHHNAGWGHVASTGAGAERGLAAELPAGWGQVASTGAGAGRGLTAELPAGWLASVWAPGLALVGGHLVVAVREAAWPRAKVLALPAPGTEPVELSLRSAAGRWVVVRD